MRQNWQLWESALSPEYCNEIIEIGKEQHLQDATIFADQECEVIDNFRKTKICWMEDTALKSIAEDYILQANRDVYNFDVDFLPSLQFGSYSESCFYKYHHDIDWNSDRMYDRKLSIAIQLSDPQDYEGGLFEFKTIENPLGYMTQGSVLVFPSYNEHRITKVDKGVRHSIVGWMEGPRWR